MTGVYSLWTEASDFRLTRDHAMLFSLGVSLGSSCFETTELVSDKEGLELADRLGWDLTSYSSGLVNFCPKKCKHIWMLGKIQAQLLNSAKPHVHLDLDFHLYEPLHVSLYKHPVFVQSKDVLDSYLDGYVQSVIKMCDIRPDVVPYNMGIVGWSYMDFCREYCRRSLKLAERIADKVSHGGISSIVCEQALLSHMAKERGLKVHTLVPSPSVVSEIDFERHKFTHYWGSSKSSKRWLTAAEERFSRTFPEEYRRFCRGWELVNFDFIVK